MQHDDGAGRLVGDARIENRGWSVAAARVDHGLLFGQFAAANPHRAKDYENDASAGQRAFPQLEIKDFHFLAPGAASAAIAEGVIELDVCDFSRDGKWEQGIGVTFSERSDSPTERVETQRKESCVRGGSF